MVVLHPPQDPALFHLLDCRLRSSKVGKDRWNPAEDDDILHTIIKRNPLSASTKYPFDSVCILGSVRPIYAAVALGASADVVELLCDACPAALLDRSACGWAPLHVACSFGAPLEVVELLAERCPGALAARDIKKQTPLHAACESQALPDVIEYLVRMRPEALSETACSSGVYGQTPLHIACGYAAPFGSVSLLLHSHPQAARETDKDGRVPLHLACCHYLYKAQNLSSVYSKVSPKNSLGVVRLLLEENPWAVKARGGRKWGTPLTLASNKRISNMSSILESLLVVNDLIDTDPLSNDFPHIIAYFKTIGWAKGASMLLDVHPNFLHIVHFDLKITPLLLAKFGHDNRLRAVSSVVKEMPMMLENA